MKWIKQKLWMIKYRWIRLKTGPKPWSKPRRWQRRNRWFGGSSEQDNTMTMAAFFIHKEAMEMGLDAEEQPYYEYLDGQMRERFPEYPWKN
tara:strand:+ start:311 stop:583 length:273 start_codon:yes stop_codon:yes gene_type:complete